jgi:hypothetical protein
MRITKEDRELITDFGNQWRWLLSEPQHGASPLSPLALARSGSGHMPAITSEDEIDAESMRRYIARFFNFPDVQRNLLKDYFETIACGEKKYAHLVCYRSQRARPTLLIKSFLAIVPPGTGDNHSGLPRNHTFSHFYQVDSRTTNKRATVGVVLPMAHGLYFIGGQHTVVKGQASVPSNFPALKVIAIPWQAIEQRRSVIPALALSTNKGELHIVSRVALTPTMFTTDEQAQIGTIDSSKLSSDIDRLRAFELKESQKPLGFQNAEDIEFQTTEILNAINNIGEIDVAGFFHSGRNVPVTGAAVIERINSAFQDLHDPFSNKKGEPLTWADVRFGAISTKL